MKPRISQLAKTTRGQQTALAPRGRQDYKVATLGARNDQAHEICYASPNSHRRTVNQKYVSRNNPRESRFGYGTQVKPCRSGLRTGWVTNREYRLKGPYVVLSFLLLLFCVLCGVIVNSVLKADLALFRRPDLEKDKSKEQMNECVYQFSTKWILKLITINTKYIKIENLKF